MNPLEFRSFMAGEHLSPEAVAARSKALAAASALGLAQTIEAFEAPSARDEPGSWQSMIRYIGLDGQAHISTNSFPSRSGLDAESLGEMVLSLAPDPARAGWFALVVHTPLRWDFQLPQGGDTRLIIKRDKSQVLDLLRNLASSVVQFGSERVMTRHSRSL